MSLSKISPKVLYRLWGSAAGRCQYDGCNLPLWFDQTTHSQYNTAYVAHIIADKPGGPRGDPILSEKLQYDYSNLMLLCDAHHRLVDKEDVTAHSVERLRNMKRIHEERIAIQTEMGDIRKSHILHYCANVGDHIPVLDWARSKQAISGTHYPAEQRAIELSLRNSSVEDNETEYWQLEQMNLRRQFAAKVKPRLGIDIAHLSVFGIAPQPLLIELGQLLSDLSGIEVYQHQREPIDSWTWPERSSDTVNYQVLRPSNNNRQIALVLSLSATIEEGRIKQVLGEDVSIWTIKIQSPSNDFLKSRLALQEFRTCLRGLFDEIKLTHGQDQTLHFFPAAPVAIAIEVGRVWMPKADLPLRIYDQSSKVGGFRVALDLGHNPKQLSSLVIEDNS